LIAAATRYRKTGLLSSLTPAADNAGRERRFHSSVKVFRERRRACTERAVRERERFGVTDGVLSTADELGVRRLREDSRTRCPVLGAIIERPPFGG